MQEKQRIRRAFANASGHYNEFAQLQRMVAGKVLAHSQMDSLQGRILDIGCGTGFLTQHLRQCGGYQHLIALDMALPMLHKARQGLGQSVSYLCADAEALPIKNASLDVVFSSLALQWCLDLPAALADFRRVLKPGGRLVFATFGAQTLSELKHAWAAVDSYRHVNDFYTSQQLRDFLTADAWRNVFIEQQVCCSHYTSVSHLMTELKGLGAKSVTGGKNPHLTSKRALRQMIAAYPTCAMTGGIRASFEIIWVKAEAV